MTGDTTDDTFAAIINAERGREIDEARAAAHAAFDRLEEALLAALAKLDEPSPAPVAKRRRWWRR